MADAARAPSFHGQFGQADERYTAEIEPMFGAVRCPLAILWGADDPGIPLERGRRLAKCMPSSI